MEETPACNDEVDRPGHYEIRLKGRLDRRWADWFDGMHITWIDNGDTVLAGPVVDQAALHCVFKRIRDLSLPLVSVVRTEIDMSVDTSQHASGATPPIDE